MKNRKKYVSRTPTPKWAQVSTTIKVNDPDLTWDEVLAVLKFFNLSDREFAEWIYGQTCPLLPNGNTGYFHYDVKRYLEWKIRGITPIWD